MKIHTDEKETFKKRIEENKDKIDRMNREIQKKKQRKENK